ncbi:hypothetical protein [Nocardia huaxiensis]|uniref:hypothetical protein n=1 Tax=Nocardia huaxiensis TaxID=2755382 RepID=UPI001E38D431|nr:hypothetical protein [Nocardia huaxiensis]UFS94799.1 hypothetical protein LPY97_29330 [Nocardia huaxiensis]
MKMRKFAGIAALVITAMGVATGTAGAAPAKADDGVINYTTTTTETQSIIRTDSGSLVVEDGVFKVKAANGTTVAGTELKFRVDDFEFPIAADIAGNTATLTPQFDIQQAVYKPVALPYEDQAPWKNQYDREVAAWNRLTSTISMGATIGTLVGGIGGAALGCVLGAGVAFAATLPLAALFGTGPLGGCIIGASLVGFLGTVGGQIFVTAPVAILAAVQYFTTINQGFTAPAK